jgi:hypothetical protein
LEVIIMSASFVIVTPKGYVKYNSRLADYNESSRFVGFSQQPESFFSSQHRAEVEAKQCELKIYIVLPSEGKKLARLETSYFPGFVVNTIRKEPENYCLIHFEDEQSGKRGEAKFDMDGATKGYRHKVKKAFKQWELIGINDLHLLADIVSAELSKEDGLRECCGKGIDVPCNGEIRRYEVRSTEKDEKHPNRLWGADDYCKGHKEKDESNGYVFKEISADTPIYIT